MRFFDLFDEKNERRLVDLLAGLMIGIAPIVHLIVVGGIKIPYGRHTSRSWGPALSARVSWLLMESPAILVPVYLTLTVNADVPFTNWILLAMYMTHYTNRSIIYPLRIRGGKASPIFIVFLAFVFTTCNGYMQTLYHLRCANYDSDWIYQPNFIVGASLFIWGMRTNIICDGILRDLRKPGETGYKIPHGSMFEYVSCANLFAESVEWTGFALASWSIQAAAFAIFTTLMLSARSYTHHEWYLKKFDNYPKHRKIFVPYLI